MLTLNIYYTASLSASRSMQGATKTPANIKNSCVGRGEVGTSLEQLCINFGVYRTKYLRKIPYISPYHHAFSFTDSLEESQ